LDLLADLNEPQKLAVTHGEGPLLVLAGAGSGKTRVITRRVAYLVQQGVPPWQVLAVTFTNKAAGEMRERVEALGTPRGATIGTFHSLCARLLREFAAEAGLQANYTIYDRDDQLRLIKQALEALELAGGRLQPASVHAAISNAKNELKTADDYAEAAGTFFERQVAEAYRAYARGLASNNALDFDDLLLRMAMLLRDRPAIRELLGRRYRHVLIDEYQDTNHAQYLIAHGIALDHENLCATGDPDQSIYAWRGADIRNILEFETDYPRATVVRLEENYRSTKPILAAASRLIARNAMRKRKALWTSRSGGAAVRVVLCDDERSEAQEIARRAAAWRAAGGDYADLAVFYRVNSLSRVVEQTLFEAGVPYRVARGVEFFNRKEVKDLLAYLKLMVNPADDLSCLRIINTPARGIGATTVKRLRAFAERTGRAVLAAAREADESVARPRTLKRLHAFAGMIDALAADVERPVRELVEDVYARSGMEEAFAGRDEEHRQQRSNLEELVTTAAEFDARTGGSLADYLYQVSLVSDLDHFDGSGGAVTLMTLHAAKGLEFDGVFLVGCEEGLLPFDRSQWRPGRGGEGLAADLEEERRLAFVGMTRAKDELTLTCAAQRMIRGQTLPRSPSGFIDEIGRQDVTVEDLTTPASRLPPEPPRRRGRFYEDADERAVIEAMHREHPLPPEYEYFCEGSRVWHPRFGPGTVERIGTQPWPDTRAKVAFDRVGVKTFVVAKADLELAERQ
jgi:DNA helicase-2/ATP-dependent DNA helicase PcrA